MSAQAIFAAPTPSLAPAGAAAPVADDAGPGFGAILAEVDGAHSEAAPAPLKDAKSELKADAQPADATPTAPIGVPPIALIPPAPIAPTAGSGDAETEDGGDASAQAAGTSSQPAVPVDPALISQPAPGVAPSQEGSADLPPTKTPPDLTASQAAPAQNGLVNPTPTKTPPSPTTSQPALGLPTAGVELQPSPPPSGPASDTQRAADAALLAAAAVARPANAPPASSPPQVTPPPAADTLRPRDIIEKALQRAERADGKGATAAAAGGQTSSAVTPPANPTQTPTPPTDLVAARTETGPWTPPSPDVAVAALPAETPDTAASAPGRPTVETASASPQNLSLSTISRAAVEATAQIAAQIVRKLEGRSTRFEMALTPDDLGRVDVSLEIDADGRLAARLAFDNPAAATDLRGRADELRRQLQDAGFQIAHDGLDFSQRDPSAGGGFDRRQSRAFAGASRLAVDADAAVAPAARWVSLTLTPQGVDMKV